jgi:predicted ATPase
LREKRALLLLDNFEQVAPAAPLVAELLAAAPGLKAIVTSREMLHLYGEHEYSVPPLRMPDLKRLPPIERLTQYEAVRLFIERAQAVRADFAVTTENAPAVAEICARLDGLPLAIELAAARSKLFSPRALLARLGRRLALLTGGPRDLPARQQTLRDTIAWSYDLLDATERALFARLGVFVGGCSLPAAEAVLGDDSKSDKDFSLFIPSDAVLSSLSSLIDKSLLKQVEGAEGEPRFVMLETIREFALEYLAEGGDGEAERIRRKHLEYFLRLAEQAEQELIGPRQAAWWRRIVDEMDNLRGALGWSLEQNLPAGLRLASVLMIYWNTPMPVREGIDWLSQLLGHSAALNPTSSRAQALTVLSYLNTQVGAEARSFAEEGLALYRELGDQQGIASALFVLGGSYIAQGDYEAGYPLMLESLALYRTLGNTFRIAFVLSALGSMVGNQDYAQARAYLEESLVLYRELGHVGGMSYLLSELGSLELRHGNYAAARANMTEAIEIQRGLGLPALAEVIYKLGELALRQGDYELARSSFEESVSLFRESGETLYGASSLLNLGYVALRQGDHERAYALFVEGQEGFKQVGNKIGVVYALEGLASLAVAQGHLGRAVRLFAWADTMREAIGDWRSPVDQADIDRDFAIIYSQLDKAMIEATRAKGRELTMEQAIAEALEV